MRTAISVIPGRSAVEARFSLKLSFERGNAETEASETNHCEGPPINPEADVRAGPVGTGDLGTAADQQDLGCHLPAAGTRSGLELAVPADLREREGVAASAVPAGRAPAAGLER